MNEEFKKLTEKEYFNFIFNRSVTDIKTTCALYYKLFKTFPNIYMFYINKSGKLVFMEYSEYNSTRTDNCDNNTYYIKVSSLNKIFKEYIQFSASELNYGNKKLYISDEKVIIYIPLYVDSTSFTVLTTDTSILNNIKTILEPEILGEDTRSIPKFKWVTTSRNGISTKIFNVECNYDIDTNLYYNDSLPYNDLINFCNSNNSGLSLLHGIPGCGKTTLIKSLMYNTNKTFYMLDANMLANSTTSDFIDFLMDECENNVFILEDCEKLLMNRNISHNPWIGTFLNLTDGMLGEGLKIKFICTFNSDLSTIDKALLREGRLSICYEFKPLCKEKAKVLCEKENREFKGRDMTLAEIFKSKITDSKLDKNTNKIGF